jgi:hypothetical protein
VDTLRNYKTKLWLNRIHDGKVSHIPVRTPRGQQFVILAVLGITWKIERS